MTIIGTKKAFPVPLFGFQSPTVLQHMEGLENLPQRKFEYKDGYNMEQVCADGFWHERWFSTDSDKNISATVGCNDSRTSSEIIPVLGMNIRTASDPPSLFTFPRPTVSITVRSRCDHLEHGPVFNFTRVSRIRYQYEKSVTKNPASKVSQASAHDTGAIARRTRCVVTKSLA
jgi:hypothetical protein